VIEGNVSTDGRVQIGQELARREVHQIHDDDVLPGRSWFPVALSLIRSSDRAAFSTSGSGSGFADDLRFVVLPTSAELH
jgi:hypothetical protein